MNLSAVLPSMQHEPDEALGWPTRRRDLLLMAAGAVFTHVVVYSLANHFPGGTVRQLELTAVDRAVPFWPWTVFLYFSDYLLIFVAFQGCRSRISAARFLGTELVIIGFSVLVHWSLPVSFPRELYPLPGDLAVMPRHAMELLRAFDRQTSCLPSLHVAGAIAAALMIRREQPRSFPWLFAWALLVTLSTLTTKQHYLFDVLAGAAVAALASLLVQRFVPLSTRAVHDVRQVASTRSD